MDSVTDFNVSESDKIQLSKAIFTAFTATGALTTGFVSGAGLTMAATATDRLIFNTTDGKLYYDADGSGTVNTPIQFATVTLTGTLSNAQFEIIA